MDIHFTIMIVNDTQNLFLGIKHFVKTILKALQSHYSQC